MMNGKVYNITHGSHSVLQNNEFRRQYNAFLLDKIEKTVLNCHDILFYCYFLVLQDRITEAIEIFNKLTVDNLPEDGSLLMQYDYMTAYLDFYSGHESNYSLARKIAEKYKDYPVINWRNLFLHIKTQLDEYD